MTETEVHGGGPARQRLEYMAGLPADEFVRLLKEAADAAERGEDELSMLERAAKVSFSDSAQACEILRKCPNSGKYPFLHASVLAQIWCNRARLPNEGDLRRYFYDNLQSFFPGARAIKFKQIKGNIPDGMLMLRNREVPVEIKRHEFDEKAREQLQRYMKVYDCERGIAVAPKLTCTLPSSMIFVAVSLPERAASHENAA